jgi:hypothetical protein
VVFGILEQEGCADVSVLLVTSSSKPPLTLFVEAKADPRAKQAKEQTEKSDLEAAGGAQISVFAFLVQLEVVYSADP